MTVWEFCILVLAASASLDAWFNGNLFAEVRSILQLRADEWESPPSVGSATESPEPEVPPVTEEATGEPTWFLRCLYRIAPPWLGALLSCSFCSSYHVPWLLLIGFYLPSRFLAAPWNWIVLLPLYSLAATRVVQILNQLLPRALQFDRNKDE